MDGLRPPGVAPLSVSRAACPGRAALDALRVPVCRLRNHALGLLTH